MPAGVELPEHYPQETIETDTLKDGTQVFIRPILPSDAPLLQENFRRLSLESIYMRFLESFRELSDERAREFATVDYQNRMAFVAVVLENDEPQIVGVARYAMLGKERPGMAESAIIVLDDYQSRGMGMLLMRHLVLYAQAHGVKGFVGTIHATNNRIMKFIQKSGLPTRKELVEPGVWEFCIDLIPDDDIHPC